MAAFSAIDPGRVTPCGGKVCGHGRTATAPVIDSRHLRFRWDAARTRAAPADFAGLDDVPGGVRELMAESVRQVALKASAQDGGWRTVEESIELAKVREAITPLLSPYGIEADAEAFDNVIAVPGLLGSVLSAASDALGLQTRATSFPGVSRSPPASGPRTVADVVRGRFRMEMASPPASTPPVVSPHVDRVLVKKNDYTGATEDHYYPGDEDIPERDDTDTAEESTPFCSSWWPTIEGCSSADTALLERVRSYLGDTCGDIPDVTDEAGLSFRAAFRSGDVGNLTLTCVSDAGDNFAYFRGSEPDKINLGEGFFGAQPFDVLHDLGFLRREVRAGMLLHEAAHALQYRAYGGGDDVLDLDPFPDKVPSCYYDSTPDSTLGNAFNETNAAYVQYLYYGLSGCAAQAAACGYGRRFTADFARSDDEDTNRANALESYALTIAEILACEGVVASTTLVSLAAVAISAVLASAGLAVVLDLLNLIVLLVGAATAIGLVLAAIHLGLE